MKNFRDRVVVITGAGSGIGLATARAFAGVGSIVHVVDFDADRAAAAKKELERSGSEAHAHTVDVREPTALEELAAAVYERHGRVDVLINNAGVGHGGYVHELTLEEWRWVIDTNLWGVIHGVHAFVPRMIKQGGASHIVNTASLAGLIGIPSMVPYCSSKFAVVGLSESLGAELAPHGISVSAICPGIVATNIIADSKLGGSVGDRKERILRYYEKSGIKPETVAADIIKAVRGERPVQLTIGSAYPALWLKRLSPRLFRGAASFAARKLLGRGGEKR